MHRQNTSLRGIWWTRSPQIISLPLRTICIIYVAFLVSDSNKELSGKWERKMAETTNSSEMRWKQNWCSSYIRYRVWTSTSYTWHPCFLTLGEAPITAEEPLHLWGAEFTDRCKKHLFSRMRRFPGEKLEGLKFLSLIGVLFQGKKKKPRNKRSNNRRKNKLTKINSSEWNTIPPAPPKRMN